MGSSARFFACDVLNTESITKAVRETAEWANRVNKPIGGVIPAAGVSAPATVCSVLMVPDVISILLHSLTRV